MKKILLITLVMLAVLVSACAPFVDESTATPSPIYTVVQPRLIETFTPLPTSTEILTETPMEAITEDSTLEPGATTAPIDTLTPIVEETLTPVAVSNNYTSALITNVSMIVTKGSAPCASGTPVSVTSYITSNNQTELQYKWLLSGTQSQTGAVRKTDMLSTAGTITLSMNYKLKCGKYSIYFQVIYPNFVTGKKNFSIP